MSRLLAITLAPPHSIRMKLMAISVAVATLLGPTLLTSDVKGTPTPTHQAGLRDARARAVAEARSHAASRLSRSDHVPAARVRTADATHAAALFAAHSWYVAPPPPPPPPAPTVSAASLAPPVPTAPPLPFQYMGSYQAEGAAQVFFLTHGDRVYDAKIGDILENTYSVDGFNGSQLLLTYKPLNIQQQLPVGGSQ